MIVGFLLLGYALAPTKGADEPWQCVQRDWLHRRGHGNCSARDHRIMAANGRRMCFNTAAFNQYGLDVLGIYNGYSPRKFSLFEGQKLGGIA